MNILKSELYKLKKSMMFRVCVLVCVTLAFFFAFSVRMGIARGGEFASMADNMSAVELLGETFKMTWLPTIFAIFISIFVSGEFHNGTIKNYVSKGFNRVRIYLSKLAVCGIASLAMYSIYIVALLTVGTFIWGFDPHGIATIGNMAAMLLGVGLLMLAFTSVSVLVSMWLRSPGAAIAVNVCIVSLLSAFLMGVNYLTGDSITLTDFWIMGRVSDLATLTPAKGATLQGVIVGLFYLAGSSVAGSMVFSARDIK